MQCALLFQREQAKRAGIHSAFVSNVALYKNSPTDETILAYPTQGTTQSEAVGNAENPSNPNTRENRSCTT